MIESGTDLTEFDIEQHIEQIRNNLVNLTDFFVDSKITPENRADVIDELPEEIFESITVSPAYEPIINSAILNKKSIEYLTGLLTAESTIILNMVISKLPIDPKISDLIMDLVENTVQQSGFDEERLVILMSYFPSYFYENALKEAEEVDTSLKHELFITIIKTLCANKFPIDKYYQYLPKSALALALKIIRHN